MHVWNKNKKKDETKRFLQEIRGTKTLTNSNQQGAFNRIGMTSQSHENSQVSTNGLTRRVNYPNQYPNSRNSSPNQNSISFSSSQNSIYPRQRSINPMRPSQIMRPQYDNYGQRDQRDIEYYDGNSPPITNFNRQVGQAGQAGQRTGNMDAYYRRDTQAQRLSARDPDTQVSQRAQISQISQLQQIQQIQQMQQMQQMQQINQLNQISQKSQISQMSQMSQVPQQNKDRRFLPQNVSQPLHYDGHNKQVCSPIIYQNVIPQYISPQLQHEVKTIYYEVQPEIIQKTIQKPYQMIAKTQNKKKPPTKFESQQISTNRNLQQFHSQQTQFSRPLLTLTSTINQKVIQQPFKISQQQKGRMGKVFEQIHKVDRIFQEIQRKSYQLRNNAKSNRKKIANMFKQDGKFSQLIKDFNQEDKRFIFFCANTSCHQNQVNNQIQGSTKSQVSMGKDSFFSQNTVQAQIQI